MKKLITAIAVLIVGFTLSDAYADVKPNPIFSDNAVLQRNVPVPVWGTAEPGEKVTVHFQNQNVSTIARNGKWFVRLKPLREGGPFSMIIKGKNTVEIKNVLIGEVWLASGQSNMAWPLSATENAQKVISVSTDPMMRLATVPRVASQTPLDETDVKWEECNPDTSAGFSAVAYFFGRELRKALGCPVGLINASWGGTRIEAWMSSESLDEFGDQVDRSQVKPGKEPNPNKASVLYNGLIAPIIPYPIAGVIWYQGESNAQQAYLYDDLLSAMIRDWRGKWAQQSSSPGISNRQRLALSKPLSGFPFLVVQLAPYGEIATEPKESKWAELREAQSLTIRAVPKTAIAVITDCGDPKDIHPKRKEPVGARLALAARAIAYGQKVSYLGPTYKSMQVFGNRAILEFDNAEGGLVAKNGELSGFTIAGEDRKFHTARATILGSRVVVSSDQVAKPVAVRFGWADCPVVNLFNQAGLPASPFRTDNFPMVTEIKRPE